MRFCFSKSRPLLGVAINDTQLSIVELSHKKGQFHLHCYGTVALNEGEVIDQQIIDSEQMGHNISTLITAIKAKTNRVATALSSNLVITREIELPVAFSDLDIEAQIRVDADQYIPYPLGEASLDFEILGLSDLEPNYYKILLVVSRTELIEQLSDALIFGGLQPKVIDIVPEALQRSVKAMLKANADYPEVVALVDIGSKTTTVYIVRNAKFVFQLQQLFGESQWHEVTEAPANLSPGLPIDEMIATKLTTTLFTKLNSKAMAVFVDKLSQYLSIAFEQYATEQYATEVSNEVGADNISRHHTVGHIILSGSATRLPQLDSHLQSSTGLKVTVANPFSSMTLAGSIDTEQLVKDAPQLMTACGLAMLSQTSLKSY